MHTILLDMFLTFHCYFFLHRIIYSIVTLIQFHTKVRIVDSEVVQWTDLYQIEVTHWNFRKGFLFWSLTQYFSKV
jgi:hypothetical protein